MRKGKELKKVSVRLYSGDIERLQAICPWAQPNTIMRELVHRYINVQEARVRAEAGLQPLSVNLDLTLSDFPRN